MVLGPVSYPAEVHCTTVSALQNGKFSRLGGEPPPYLPKFRPCEGTDFHLSAQLLSSRTDILTLPKALTTSFGTNSISFRGSILWNSTPDVIKSSNTVFSFIKNIKNWSGEVCNCNICI